MAQLGRCILLTGAPAAEDLNWEEKNLHSHFDKGSRTSSHARTDDSQQVESSWQAPKWRALATTPERAQRSRERPQTQFFSFSDQLPELDIAKKQDFLEHSIALIDDLVSSQIAPTAVDETTFLNSTTLSFASDTSRPISDVSELSKSPTKQQLPSNLPLTDIKQIPPASHILSISPQTMTINLLCAVISVSQPRSVKLRRRAATMEILDLVLGDDTRAGFSVSFWLPPLDSQHSRVEEKEDLRATLQSLRAGDVVFTTNVALSVWRSAVYGQSLGRRWARNSTRVFKVETDGSERGLSFGAAGKLARVKCWRDEFIGKSVGTQGVGKGKKRSRRGYEEELPPDTQD